MPYQSPQLRIWQKFHTHLFFFILHGCNKLWDNWKATLQMLYEGEVEYPCLESSKRNKKTETSLPMHSRLLYILPLLIGFTKMVGSTSEKHVDTIFKYSIHCYRCISCRLYLKVFIWNYFNGDDPIRNGNLVL